MATMHTLSQLLGGGGGSVGDISGDGYVASGASASLATPHTLSQLLGGGGGSVGDISGDGYAASGASDVLSKLLGR